MKTEGELLTNVCLLAGKIMLQCGAETYRVEDTMNRIAGAKVKSPAGHSFVTPTGIIFSIDDEEPTKFIRIVTRATDLEKVSKVNSISREIGSGRLGIEEAYTKLKEIDRSEVFFPVWLQIIAAAVASGCFALMFGGSADDFLPAFIAGGLGYSVFIYFHKISQIRFFAELLAAFVLGFAGVLFVRYGFGAELEKVIIGAVMPLVPGVLITNAIRDLMAGHLVAGLSKSAEAMLTAFAIGSGIAAAISIF